MREFGVPAPLAARERVRVGAVLVARELHENATRVAPLEPRVGARLVVGLGDRLDRLVVVPDYGAGVIPDRVRRHRQLVVESSLPVVQRPAAPEQQRAGRVVAVERGREDAQLVRRAREAQVPVQGPLDADRAYLLAEPRVDGGVRVRERALPTELRVLERERRVERADADLLLIRRLRDRPPVQVGLRHVHARGRVVLVIGDHRRRQRLGDPAAIQGE